MPGAATYMRWFLGTRLILARKKDPSKYFFYLLSIKIQVAFTWNDFDIFAKTFHIQLLHVQLHVTGL
jgi:hypothetical protein